MVACPAVLQAGRRPQPVIGEARQESRQVNAVIWFTGQGLVLGSEVNGHLSQVNGPAGQVNGPVGQFSGSAKARQVIGLGSRETGKPGRAMQLPGRTTSPLSEIHESGPVFKIRSAVTPLSGRTPARV